jgi:hypothetical protein
MARAAACGARRAVVAVVIAAALLALAGVAGACEAQGPYRPHTLLTVAGSIACRRWVYLQLCRWYLWQSMHGLLSVYGGDSDGERVGRRT